MKMKSEECRMKKQRSAAKGKANRLAHTLLLIAIYFMASMTPAIAQQNSDRISLGFGCLYERGLDVTLSYEHETKYHNAWEYLPMATSSGTNAPRAVMCVLRASGTTTAVMVSALPINPVW